MASGINKKIGDFVEMPQIIECINLVNDRLKKISSSSESFGLINSNSECVFFDESFLVMAKFFPADLTPVFQGKSSSRNRYVTYMFGKNNSLFQKLVSTHNYAGARINAGFVTLIEIDIGSIVHLSASMSIFDHRDNQGPIN